MVIIKAGNPEHHCYEGVCECGTVVRYKESETIGQGVERRSKDICPVCGERFVDIKFYITQAKPVGVVEYAKDDMH